MIESEFIIVFLLFIIINIFFLIVFYQDIRGKRRFLLYGSISLIIIVIPIVFFPIPIDLELIELMNNEGMGLSNNFIPFRTIFTLIVDGVKYKAYSVVLFQLCGNIFLFIPYGFFLKMLSGKKHLTKKEFFLIVFLTLSIETFQGILNHFLGVNYRAVDIDDIILNLCGGLIGFYSVNIAIFIIKSYKLFKKKYLKNKC